MIIVLTKKRCSGGFRNMCSNCKIICLDNGAILECVADEALGGCLNNKGKFVTSTIGMGKFEEKILCSN